VDGPDSALLIGRKNVRHQRVSRRAVVEQPQQQPCLLMCFYVYENNIVIFRFIAPGERALAADASISLP
jgi:hypothetical protein